MSYCHTGTIWKQLYVTTSPYISWLVALIINAYATFSNINYFTDVNVWLISSISCCMLTMFVTIATRFRSAETWIKFVHRNSIISYIITRKILFHLLREHTPHLQVLRGLPGRMGSRSAIDSESTRISKLNSINRIFDASYFKYQQYKSFMIHGIHSFLQSIFIAFIIRDQQTHNGIYQQTDTGISTVVWSLILTAYIIDFGLTSLFYVALVFPQFHLRSFIFLWLCFMTDYMRLLLSISWSLSTLYYAVFAWIYGCYSVLALVSFVAICLSFTHVMELLSCRPCVIPRAILWWFCLVVVYCIFWCIIAELLAVSWIAIILYHRITQHFEKYDNVDISDTLNESISFINNAMSKHDEIYRLFAINKTQTDGSAKPQLSNEWMDEMIQTQCKTIGYKDIRLHFPNIRMHYTIQPSKALFQYKSLFHILTKHYPIDFDGFGYIPSAMNTFFVGVLVVVLLPCYILSRVVRIVYPLVVLGGVNIKTDNYMDNTCGLSLLIIVCCLMVVVLYLMIRIVLLYDKLWYIGAGCRMSEIDINNMVMANVWKHYRMMKSYEFAHQIILQIYDQDIGTIILAYLNDSFTSHIECPQLT
eukprot:157749_1